MARTPQNPLLTLGSALISYLGPLLAVIVGIVHAAIAPVIVIGGVKPNLVLVAVVLVTCFAGVLPGITWAFIAGLTANLLVGEPLGAVPLAMLVVAALVAGGARLVGRVGWIYPVVAAFGGSLVADAISLGLAQLLADATLTRLPVELMLAAGLLNAGVCAVLVIPARLAAMRYAPEEGAAW